MAPALIALLAGAGAGAAGGGVGGVIKSDSDKKKWKAIIAGNKELSTALSTQYGGDVEKLASDYASILTGYDPGTYLQGLKDRDFSKYDISAPEAFEFDTKAETQAQMNPELDAITERASQGLQNSAANAGQLFSGATGKKIVRSTADITAKEWDAAAGRAQNERNNKYQAYIDNFNNLLKVNEVNKGNYVSGLQGQDQAFGIQSGAWQNKQTLGSNMKQDFNAQDLQLKQELLQAEAEKNAVPGFWGSLFGGAAGGATSGAAAVAPGVGGLK